MRREVERRVEDYDRERVVRVVLVGGGMIGCFFGFGVGFFFLGLGF